jgi:hypothetical protein
MRWKLLLEEYDYEIQYRAGQRNCNAYSLSRYPVEGFNINIEEITDERKRRIIAEMHKAGRTMRRRRRSAAQSRFL